MTAAPKCPECGGRELYSREGIHCKGAYGPDLLPGLGGLFSPVKMKAIVCVECGCLRYFVRREDRRKLADAKHWSRLG